MNFLLVSRRCKAFYAGPGGVNLSTHTIKNVSRLKEFGVTFEPPVKGNPHQFVIKQHFHTAHAISKFYGSDEKVDVHNLKTGKTSRKHKREKIFCAKRNWDQKAEIGIMAKIENEFHEEINTSNHLNLEITVLFLNISFYGELGITFICREWKIKL